MRIRKLFSLGAMAVTIAALMLGPAGVAQTSPLQATSSTDGDSPISNFTVIYDPNGKIVNYAETLYSKSDNRKVVACLGAIAGIGGPAAYIIVGACAGACSAPEPTVTKGICAACVGAYAALGAGGMGAAAACFQLW
ncbi:hypothetical protein [Gleimia hominis]|uniref:hypothetical protein n=1 Tax=Gleimia hominis TaxID=595468 RepID=UPI0011AF6B82|nr:hypothetical protein [Gleimia hominis]WIK64379.1 hypothetical protein CJ187_008775 [Gleimia hominis]